ncbi:MAG: YigZ family protein [Anaerolineales bacterium]|nr:YigZ family protein [Anaerolineales bacterium]
MSTRYPIPAAQTRAEIEVKNSRFIATAVPTFSVDEAKAFIKRIKDEFADASHNVPAYQIGFGASVIAHCNDDGEPSGTAGRPMLAVIQGSGLGDIAVVVTRYFGGTKLGTGGLVRAYGDAVKAVLAVLPLAEKVPTHTVMLALPYSHLDRVRLLVAAHNGRLLDETFTADITLSVQFTVDQFPAFQAALQEMTHGTLAAEIVETNPETIMPLGAFATSGEDGRSADS